MDYKHNSSNRQWQPEYGGIANKLCDVKRANSAGLTPNNLFAESNFYDFYIMAKKTRSTEPSYVEASLKIQREKFVELLNKQIEKGEQLIQTNVPIIAAPSAYGSFYQTRAQDYVKYDETAENAFIDAYSRWHDYNVEIYKTSFTAPNSTYRQKYESHVGYHWESDVISDYKDEIRRLINQMKADIDKVDLIPCVVGEVLAPPKESKAIDKTSIFIVHGHDDSAINEVKVFLMKLGFNPIILREQPNEGQTIIEKIERYTNVGFGVVLYTPCDEGKSKEASEYQNRARQNVVFEHGYLCAKLGRSNVCALVKGELEIPGDLGGVVYTPMTQGWELLLAKELKAVGYQFDPAMLIM